MENYLKEEKFKELVSVFTNYIAINPDILTDNFILQKYLLRKKNPSKPDYIINKKNSNYIINIKQKANEFNVGSLKENKSTLAIQIIEYENQIENYKNFLTECIIIFDKKQFKIVDVADYVIYDNYYKKK